MIQTFILRRDKDSDMHFTASFINNFFNMIQHRRTRPILTAQGEENKLVRVTLEQMTEKLSDKSAFHIGKRKVQVNRIKLAKFCFPVVIT